MKIIDADKLHYKQVYVQTEKGLRPALVVFAKEIRKMPEIVRCKDCVYCKHFNDVWYAPKSDELLCTLHVETYHTTENDFCSWGERREDETC